VLVWIGRRTDSERFAAGTSRQQNDNRQRFDANHISAEYRSSGIAQNFARWFLAEVLEKVVKLRQQDICPIHRSRFCCGRESKQSVSHVLKWKRIGPGVKQHIETGLIRRSPAAMRDLLAKKVIAQNNLCSLCGKEFTDAREITPDHTEPRGMGAARRNDAEENITAAHANCNREKGSKRL
jgi:hypothetical protein